LSDEDSDAELVTPEVDVAILRTLARIRQKDPLVYEDGRQVFDGTLRLALAARPQLTSWSAEEEQRTASTSGPTKAKATKTKPVLLKDYQRSRLIADPTASLPDTVSAAGFLPTFAQEESALRAETTKAFHGVDSDDESEGEDLLQPREKTKDEREKEDEEYQKFLKENVGDREVEDALEQEEKFLRE
jgi:protein KRI1